jgi:ATP-dependent DNA ligase
MTDKFSPMLAAKAPAILKALFKDLPKGVQIVVQPKLDGVRALVIGVSIRLRDGALSALRCRNIDGQEFRLGSGFSEADRQTLPDLNPIGKIIKYAYSPGQYTAAPRHPVFLGFRDKRDLA